VPLGVGLLQESADLGGKIDTVVLGSDPFDGHEGGRVAGAGARLAQGLQIPRACGVMNQIRG